MKQFEIGSLVKKKPFFNEWIKHNPWMALMEIDAVEIGMIVSKTNQYKVGVLWPSGCLSSEKVKELIEVPNESR